MVVHNMTKNFIEVNCNRNNLNYCYHTNRNDIDDILPTQKSEYEGFLLFQKIKKIPLDKLSLKPLDLMLISDFYFKRKI